MGLYDDEIIWRVFAEAGENKIPTYGQLINLSIGKPLTYVHWQWQGKLCSSNLPQFFTRWTTSKNFGVSSIVPESRGLHPLHLSNKCSISLLVKHSSVSFDKHSPQTSIRFHETFSKFTPTERDLAEIETREESEQKRIDKNFVSSFK